jgi:uncharacterized coiled-coil protein SlyX
MIKDMASKFTEEDLDFISSYLAEKYPAIKGNADQYRYSDIKIDIHERIVRVEEELKHQRDLIHEVLKMMDKRFEQVDKRFEELRTDMNNRFEYTNADMNRRFNMMMWFTGIGFTLITTIITGTLVLLK